MEADRPDIQSMWGCMFAGDIEINNVNKKSIFIVGNSRIGKSTFYNYISGVRLIGKQIEETGDIVLEPVLKSGVVAKDTFKAVTLVPNLTTIYQNEEQVGLIDTAGFGDQGRSYAGKFGVSYMLEKLFQNIEQVKFIICISHQIFSGGSKGQIDSLLNFIDLLQCETLLREQDLAQKFYNSISLVVTKSQNKQNQYITRLNKLVNFIKQDDKNINNEKKVLLSILESVISNKRVGLFQLANDGQQLPRPNILQKLRSNQKNWKFYSFKDNISRQSLIKMPFQKTFNRMGEYDKDLYKEHTTKKHDIIRDSFNLLKEFIAKLKENWYDHKIDLSKQFNKLQRLISRHPYGSFESMIDFLKLEFTIPKNGQRHVTRINLIKKFKQINQNSFNIDHLISNDNQVSIKILKMYKPCFQILDTCRRTFCRNQQQQRKFLTLMFIIIRSLYQCQMQAKIHKDQSAAVPFIVTGILNNILPDQIWNLTSQFLIGFKPQTTQQAQACAALLQQTIDDHIDEISVPEDAKKLIQSFIKLNLKKADNFIKKQKKFDLALGCIFKISRKFKSYTDLMPQFDQMEQSERAQLRFREIHILKKTGQCLQGLKQYSKAINIYKHIQAVSIVIRCYQDWINYTKNKKNKLIPMLSYISFLQQYGKRTKIIEVYEKMIDQFECFPQKVWRWKKKLAEVLSQNHSDQSHYAEKLAQKEKILDINEKILQVQKEFKFFVDKQNHEYQEDIDQTFERRKQMIDYDDDEQL